MNTKQQYTKCDVCKYRAGGKCTVVSNSFYCKEASDEFFAYISKKKQQPQKVLKPWERKR